MVSVQRLKPAFTADDEAPVEQKNLHAGADPHAILLQFLLIPIDVEDGLKKLLQNPPPLLRQRGKE